MTGIFRFLFHTALFTILFTVTGNAQIQLLVTPDTNKMLIGDQQKLTLSVTADTSIHTVEVDLDSVKSIAGFEILEESEWTDRSMGISHVMTRELKFTAFEPGTLHFPPLRYTYRYKGEMRTGISKPFDVTVLPLSTQTEEIEKIKDIIPEKRNFWDYAWWILGGLALAALIYFLIRHLRKTRTEKPKATAPKRAARDIALEALQRLRESGLWSSEDHKAYQYALTAIIRNYLNDQFNIPLSLTTDGVLRRLRQLRWPRETVQVIDEAFHIADLVKFANAASRAEINHSYIGRLEDIVKMTATAEFVNLNRY